MDTDPTRLSLSVQILILVALTLINAFFAAAEMAFVSVNRTKMKIIAEDTTDGDARAEKVLRLMEEPNTFLSAIQVAITFAGFLSSAFASYNMSDHVVGLFARFGIRCNAQIAVIIVTVILSYFTLVLGELFPKRLALKYSEKMALGSVNIILFTKTLFKPFVKLLSLSVDGLMKLFRQSDADDSGEFAEEEIMDLLEVGKEQGEIDETGTEMIRSIFDFDDAFAYEVMVPRPDVYMIDVNEPVSSYIDELLQTRHARIPVYEEDIDDIIGVLHMKDLIIAARKTGFDDIDIRSILKDPYFVPETKKLNELLDSMRSDKIQMAILIDEYGGFSGIVTLEDILEEIVGTIEDEYDEDEPRLEKKEDGSYVVDGLYDLDDLAEETGVDFETENSETIGGFVMDLMGIVPDEDTVGQTVEYKNCTFTIMAACDRRIEKLSLRIAPEREDEQE